MLFSVITVTRDNLSGLKRTQESLRAQGFSDYEWIVIDGASGDGTAAYLKGTGANFVSEPDRGIYDAMNKGVERARGDYIIFMNAGDAFAAPDTLEKLAEYADADFIYGDALEGGVYKRAHPHEKIARGMFTHHQAMIYRRDVVGDLRYDLSYKIAADYKFTVEFLRRAQRVVHVALPVCIFEQGGVSQQRVRLGRDEQFRIRREQRVCGACENSFIYMMQTAAMIVRRATPGLYWKIRMVRGGAGES